MESKIERDGGTERERANPEAKLTLFKTEIITVQ
jgi:hypothetical protein